MNVFRKKSVEQTLAETGESGQALKRDLTWWDLAIMGVAVAVGAGIFSIGAQAAAFHAGPAVVLSFLIAGVVCGAAVMCYAEFASMIPVAGSAYTFTYTTVGEIVAWVIGWDLILEMLMAGSVVSKYWGVYLNQFFELIGWNINTNIAIGSFNFDLAPVIIVAFFTALLVMGTKIGARVDGALTILKIAIVVFIVVVGFFYIKAENFTPFIPPSEPAASTDGSGVSAVMEQPLWQWATGMAPSIYGVTGIISGAALVFFAFLGFDVVATASEETINPKKNVPLGIGVGLGLIIVLYTLVAIVTTGMVSYKDLAKQSDPSLAVAFKMVGADWAAKIISLGIVIGMATVVMVLLLGLTRVVFAMSRDGLLPRGLSHTGKHGTPVRLQIIVGVVMALIAACCNVGEHRHAVGVHAGGDFHSDHAQEAPRPGTFLQDSWQPVGADSDCARQPVADGQPERAHLDPLRGLAHRRLRHLLRLRLPPRPARCRRTRSCRARVIWNSTRCC